MNQSESNSFPRANWRSGSPAMCESLWSVMHKFCSLNSINGHALRRYYMDQNTKCATMRRDALREWPAHLDDLRFSGGFHLAGISTAMNVHNSWIQSSTLDQIGSRGTVRRKSTAFLRFCPVCIERGFHSVLFQLSVERICPVHSEILRDFCLKCGRHIPYCNPEGKLMPYSCLCGCRLWWGLKDDEWSNAFTSEEARLFSSHFDIRIAQCSAKSMTHAGLNWLAELDKEKNWDRLLSSSEKMIKKTEVKISRVWSDGFCPRVRSMVRYPGGAYSVIPMSDYGFKERILNLYAQIEKNILRQIPAFKRRRLLAFSRTAEWWTSIVWRARYSPEFMAYVLWKNYWEDCSSFQPLYVHPDVIRRKKRHDQQRNKIYWRFSQHARLQRPMGVFTSADEWGQLHFFSIVAFAIYRSCLDAVARLESKRHSLPGLPGLKHFSIKIGQLPFVTLENVSQRFPSFELKVVLPRKRKPFTRKRAANPRIKKSRYGRVPNMIGGIGLNEHSP